ncbi:MAG: YbaB/EbfC family nucleoid-associated protein [Treponema sp.]|jgi:DNA-binding YbaB/EbfC family protein|nr:YbaB/EbfC family nucleoid-associated protein [Treponema sp.]
MNFNPFDLIKNAGAIKEQAKKIQEEMEKIVVTGESGGGIVKVTMNGKMEMTNVFLDPIAVDPRDIQMLQDLIIAAHHKATLEIKEKITGMLGPMAAGFPAL